MAVELSCLECGVKFKVKDCRAGKAKFCSRDCHGKNKIKLNSKGPYGSYEKTKNIQCEHCRTEFKSKLKIATGKYNKYCSLDCMKKSKRIQLKCSGCEKKFTRYKSEVDYKKPKNVFCSIACRCEHLNGDMCSGYNGGSYIGSDGLAYIYKSGKCKLEHRALIRDYIGRDLLYKDEPVLHINGNNSDNRMSNLYICSGWSELSDILRTSNAPYPVRSNVDDFVVKK